MTTTNRVFKTFKTITGTFSGLTGDTVLTDASGDSYWDLTDINWEVITTEINLLTLTTTNATFKHLTTNKSVTVASSADVAALKADGSTAFASAAITPAQAPGKFSISTARSKADGSAASNIGKKLGLWLDAAGTMGACAGDFTIYIQGK
jgi:hypothetical protein